MAVGPIGPVTPAGASELARSSGLAAAAGQGKGFMEMLGDALNQLGQTEQNTNQLSQRLALGDPSVDLHDVMIAAQSESLAFQLATQVRNKLVEGVQQVFQMQI